MIKKIAMAIGLVASILFLSTYAYATDGLQRAGEDVRNVVGAAENGLEDVGNGVTGAVRNGLNTAGDVTKNAAEGVKNGVSGMVNDNMSRGNYTATRTATETGFAGMSGTVWMWFILAIVALAIIGLVWYYSNQKTHSHHRD